MKPSNAMKPLLITALAFYIGYILPATAASFDCGKAATADEHAICRSCALQQRDVEMATLYGVVTHLVAMGQRGVIQDQQSAWLARRHGCGSNETCLLHAYRDRIAVLRQALQRIYRRGPF
jgi:uncharacterized protein